ncbi:MAG TPA: FAD binding domain-containing protein [bacterium]|nr:FAD binding domain-containing protein [bacterium]
MTDGPAAAGPVKVLVPRTLDEALALKATTPEAVPVAGGTDVMVELNFDRRRPPALLDLSGLAELRRCRLLDGRVALGAGATYTAIIASLRGCAPLVQASRSVGSPQIRNRGTVGGNLGTASPAGDALPVLAAYDAEIVIATAAGGPRAVSWREFLIGPKRTALPPDGLIVDVRWRVPRGPGSFSKVGPRNAMVIAIAGVCLVLDEDERAVRLALGSVAPTVVRVPEAEAAAAKALAAAGAWDDPRAPVPPAAVEGFGDLAAEAARPIDDVRSTAAYRRHACRVLARRALTWALDDRRAGCASGRA